MSGTFKKPISYAPNTNQAIKQTRPRNISNNSNPAKLESKLIIIDLTKLVKLEVKDQNRFMVSSGLNLMLTNSTIVKNINILFSNDARLKELKNLITAQKYIDIYQQYKNFTLSDFMLDLFKLIPNESVFIKLNPYDRVELPRGNKIEIILELNLQNQGLYESLVSVPGKCLNEFTLSSMILSKKCMTAAVIRMNKEYKLILPFKILSFSSWQELVIMLIELELNPCIFLYTKPPEASINYYIDTHATDYIKNLTQSSLNSVSTSDPTVEEFKNAPKVESPRSNNLMEQKDEKKSTGNSNLPPNYKFSKEESRRNDKDSTGNLNLRSNVKVSDEESRKNDKHSTENLNSTPNAKISTEELRRDYKDITANINSPPIFNYSTEESKKKDKDLESQVFVQKNQDILLKFNYVPKNQKAAPVKGSHEAHTEKSDKREDRKTIDQRKEKQAPQELNSPEQKLMANVVKDRPKNGVRNTTQPNKKTSYDSLNLQKSNNPIQPQYPIKMWNCIKCGNNNYFTKTLCSCGYFNINLHVMMSIPLIEKIECKVCNGYSKSIQCENCIKAGYYICSVCSNISMQSSKCIYCVKPEEKYRPNSMKPNFNRKFKK